MLTTWMQEENTLQWSQGLRFIQLMKNRAYHSGIKTTPYEALFVCKIKIGLNTSNLPKEIVENIETEEDLTAITESETITNATTANIIELEDASTTITKIKTNNENAINLRKNATKNLEIQADKMKKLSDKKLLPVEIGSTVGFQSQFTVCQKKLLHLDEVPALRSVASQQAVGKGLQNARHVKQDAKVKNVCVLKMKYCVTPVVILA
ncbi:hypothetical protein QTP88_022743 [Uroleucon formosanum]